MATPFSIGFCIALLNNWPLIPNFLRPMTVLANTTILHSIIIQYKTTFDHGSYIFIYTAKAIIPYNIKLDQLRNNF